MRKALLFDVDTCKEKNAGGEHITHQAEELDQGVRRVGACLAAQILHGAGGDGVDGTIAKYREELKISTSNQRKVLY